MLRPRLFRSLIAGLTGLIFLSLVGVIFSAPTIPSWPGQSKVPSTMNSTLGFEKVLLLSLPERTDRRDHMSLAFKMTGIQPALYIPGVKPDEMIHAAIPPHIGGHQPHASELGCWRAHANAWKRIVDEGWETALVLEDDVDWTIDLKEQLTQMSQMLRQWRKNFNDMSDLYPYGKQWDIFYFGHCFDVGDFNVTEESYFIYPDETVLPLTNQSQFNRELLEAFRVPSGHRMLNRADLPVCTMAYGITQKGAEKLLYRTSLVALNEAVDWEIAIACHDGTLTCLETSPPLMGLYRAGGQKYRNSDIKVESQITMGEGEAEIPMGDRSVKKLLGELLTAAEDY